MGVSSDVFYQGSKYGSAEPNFVDGNLRAPRKNCTTLTQVYTWYILWGNLIFILPSSNYLLFPHQYHSWSHIKTPENIPNLTMFKPPQYLSPIQLLYAFETAPSLKYSLTRLIPWILDKILTWGGMTVKEGILSVKYHEYLTDDSDMILLGIFTNHKEGQK